MSVIPIQLGGLFPLSGSGASGFGPFSLAGRGRGFSKRKAASQTDAGRIIHEKNQPAATAPAAECLVEQRTDETLLKSYMAGDRAAFTTLMQRYSNELLHFLTRFLGSRAAADDVFQETFLQIHLSADTFDTERRFKPWLFTIAANKARDYHRKHNRWNALSLSASIDSDGEGERFVDLLEADVPSPVMPVLDAERSRLVKKAVDSLPVHLREILLLSYFQRLSYNQIADSLEIPLGTVKSRLHTAVAAFAQAWKSARSADNDDDRNTFGDTDELPDARTDGRTT